MRGPAQYNVDTSIFKDFKLRESLDMQFRAEAFNVFNRPQFAIPNPDVDTSQAGTITSTVHSARQLQFAFKFLFSGSNGVGKDKAGPREGDLVHPHPHAS